MTESKTIKTKIVRGVVAISARTALLQGIAMVGVFLLTIFLTPAEFGIFFVVSAFINLFVFFSDVGLAAALIQKKDEPTLTEYRTVFTVQQILVAFILSAVVLSTPLAKRYLELDSAGTYLLWALAISLFFAFLKTIPSIQLERKLDFGKLVLPQILENLVFYSVAVYLAHQGHGITSYTIAVLARGIIGVIALYLINPWKIGFKLDKAALIPLLKFGIPFQVNDLLARVKDDLLIVVLRGALGATSMGYLAWAQKWSLYPFRLTVDSIIRVTFPAYSRLQAEKLKLQLAIEKSLFFISLILFPLLVGMAVLAIPLTELIPRYTKWQPAVIILYFMLVNVTWASIVVPIVNSLNALGYIKKTLRMMLILTTAMWLITIPLTYRFGLVGAAVSFAFVPAISLMLVPELKKHVNVSLWPQIWPATVSAVIMGIFSWQVVNLLTISWPNIFVTILVGAGVYTISIYLTTKGEIVNQMRELWLSLK